ncbi:ptpla domain protein-like protein [Dinothrombium tinctorium]|uniref:Very-long-chain (3R)-3-hydroxyacyl-CoA dehydratase n=1 Tax=Dinothrombium tinctorium TaxID=1965070 RepID=A0A3S3PDK1_9ACAR|nr:ptpla domain protein-like protein [Dinothrombium tinctorium]
MGKRGEQNLGAKVYLFVYNALQFLGWFYCLLLLLKFFSTKQTNYRQLWKQVELPLTIFQTLQLIEVLHCIIRLVPSSPFTTFIQIASRLIVVWGILKPVAETQTSIGVPLIVGSWSVAEITRYLYYALNLINCIPYFLTWCRYTFFTFLYPSGVSGELILMYTALPYIARRQIYSYQLPNPFNISFQYNLALILLMLSYIPFFPLLYFYMVGQRRKMLGGKEAGSKKAN